MRFRNNVLIEFFKIIILKSYGTVVKLIKYLHYYYAIGEQILSKRSIHNLEDSVLNVPWNRLLKSESYSNTQNSAEKKT
jgi:hypothetical protein